MRNVKFLIVLLCVFVMGCVYSQLPKLPVSKEIREPYYSAVDILDPTGLDAIGSGVVVRYEKGEKTKVLTAFHVIDGHLANGMLVPVKLAFSEEIRFMRIIKVHKKWDLALLMSTSRERFRGVHAKIAEDYPVVGDKIIVIGNPMGHIRNVSQGILSKIINLGQYGIRYRTDADVIFGNSGGGMFNEDGELIGILTNGNFLNMGSGIDPDLILVPGSGSGASLETIKEFITM